MKITFTIELCEHQAEAELVRLSDGALFDTRKTTQRVVSRSSWIGGQEVDTIEHTSLSWGPDRTCRKCGHVATIGIHGMDHIQKTDEDAEALTSPPIRRTIPPEVDPTC